MATKAKNKTDWIFWGGLLVIAVLIIIYFIDVYDSASTTHTTEYSQLCGNFPVITGEVSCEEAIEIALNEYPGEVLGIDKAQIPIIGPKEDVWLVEIYLENSIEMPKSPYKNESEYANVVEIAVNRYTEELKIYKMVGA